MTKSLFTIATALSIALTPFTASAAPKLFGNKVTIGKVADVKLTRAQYRTYKWYTGHKSYFGAFYIVRDTDDVFWTRNFHSLKTAKDAARRGCEIAYKGSDCQLYAVVFPKGVDPNSGDVSGFSQPAAKDFERRYPKQQKKGKFGAFAMNRAFGWGVSYGWDTKKEAEAAAVAFCEQSSAQALAPLPIEGRNWAKGKGLEKCRLVDTHLPSGS